MVVVSLADVEGELVVWIVEDVVMTEDVLCCVVDGTVELEAVVVLVLYPVVVTELPVKLVAVDTAADEVLADVVTGVEVEITDVVVVPAITVEVVDCATEDD